MDNSPKPLLTICSPEEVDILVAEAPLDYGYLLILEYENGDKILASSKSPSKYLSTHMVRERIHGISNPIRVGISPQLWRYEAVKRNLQKQLADYRKPGEARFSVPNDVLEQAIESVFSLAMQHRRRREGDAT